MHIILDFETAGQPHDGKILNVAYTHFDMYEVEDIADIRNRVEFHKLNFTASDQEYRGYDKETMDWWKQTAPDLIKQTFGNPESGITLTKFLEKFANYLQMYYNDSCCIWSRGNAFDITILDVEYRRLFGKLPYPFWQVRDTRSFLDPMNIISGKVNKRLFSGNINGLKQEYIAHDPIDDIAKDIQQIQLAYNTYKG